jgi:hypothetical protein
MLKEHGLGATFYVAPQNQEFTKQDLLTSQEIGDLSRDFEIGGHSMTHSRQQRILGQRVAHRERITVQLEHRTSSNSGHMLTLPRANPA